MKGGDYVARLVQRMRVEDLERKVSEWVERGSVMERAAHRVREGANLTREEAAAFLHVSTKKVQRMDSAGTLPRCPGFGTVVLYAARDVLRLASAR